MGELDLHVILMALCLVVILSYLFDLVAAKIKIPSVLLLVLTGILVKQAAGAFGWPLPNLHLFMMILGQVGLILIVLEGALDLKLEAEQLKLMESAFFSAILVLIITTGSIGIVLMFLMHIPWRTAFLNSIPLGVISSAITIPSVAGLAHNKKGFFTYESTFSDILGIMLFYFVLQNQSLNWKALGGFGLNLVAVLLVSVAATALLVFLMDRLKTHVKFFLILATLVLVYAVGKQFHLSALLLVLIFGLAINNIDLIQARVKLYFELPTLMIERELEQLKLINRELAFLIRTFFFLLFGLSIDLSSLLARETWTLGTLIILIILGVRYFYLKYIARSDIFPDLFVAPRGLITIVLFYSIPASFLIEGLSKGILLFVILVSSLLMMLGLMLSKTPVTQKDEL